jgi:hypothetical protein
MIGQILATTLALVALGQASVARADEPCLAPADLNAIFTWALPTVIDAAGQACMPVLPRESFLTEQGPALSARYRIAQAPAWPLAKAAVFRIGVGTLTGKGGGLGKFAAMLPDSAIQGFAAGFVNQFVAQAIHPADCPDVDLALRLMAPLPPENTAGLVTLVIDRIERPRPGHKPRLPLCTAAALPAPPSAVTGPEH